MDRNNVHLRYKKFIERLEDDAKEFNLDNIAILSTLLILGHSDTQIIEMLLNDKNYTFTNSDLIKFFIISSKTKYHDITRIVLRKIDMVNITDKEIRQIYTTFVTSTVNGILQLVQIFLEDSRFDPSFSNNIIIRSAYRSTGNIKHKNEIMRMLLNDPRIWNSLNMEQRAEYSTFDVIGGG